MRNLGVELLAPAGCFKTALAAFEAGADAVYCGLGDFSARAFAENFSEAELARLCAYAHGSGRKVYVTFNTLVDEADIGSAVRALSALAAIGPDALIVQDLGVADICRRSFPGLELHASTQLVAHNLEGVLALKELGFRRVVLARELSLEEVASIARRAGVFAVSEADGRSELELECFVHGALCYSLSGLCLFGAMEKGRSGNRGTCPYCCRQAYDTGRDGRRLCFSMKDLRLGEEARRLADCGVASLKIEGRMKSELYVASVTRYYRQILGGGLRMGGAPSRRAILRRSFRGGQRGFTWGRRRGVGRQTPRSIPNRLAIWGRRSARSSASQGIATGGVGCAFTRRAPWSVTTVCSSACGSTAVRWAWGWRTCARPFRVVTFSRSRPAPTSRCCCQTTRRRRPRVATWRDC